MRALFVVLALIAIGANAIQIKRSDSSWNFKLTTRSMANLPANLQAKATEINKLLTIYNARAEVAIGMAAQTGNQFTALQQVLEKAICITRAAFPASTDDAIYGGLFALPGSPYEKAWVDWHAAKQAVRQGYNPPPGGKDKAWVGTPFKDFDNDRWGPFLPSLVQYDNAPAKAAAMTAALTDNKNAVIKVINSDGKTPAADTNYRSLLHLFARMSIYGETKVANSKLPPANQFNLAHLGDMCPGSFRHALYTLHNAAAATKKDAETRCGLDLAKLTRQVAARNDMRGKNLIEFEDFSANFEAGSAPAQVGGKQVSNIAMARDPLAGAFRETRAKMLSQNTWTAARMTAAKMPPLTKYELGYLKAVTPAYNGVDAPPKFGAGGNVFDMKKTAQNADWRDAMLANGLLMSGGPSGTTDEIMQFGDYTGVTKTTAGACALKNAPLAGMLLNTHHTFAEVMQGAADGNRNLPVFNFAAPYDGLKACNDGIFDKAKEYMALFNSGIQRSNDITSVIKGSDWGKVNHDGSAQTDRMGTDDGGNDATYGGHFRFEKADEALVDPTGAIWPQVCALSPAQFPGGATAKELLCVAPVARFAEVDEEADEAEEETEEEEEDAEEEEEEEEEEDEEEEEEDEEEDEEEEEDLDEEEEDF